MSENDKRQVVKTLCRMCDDRCGINVYLEDGKIVDVDGNEDHPWNRGRLCIKGSLGPDFFNHPDRILKPLKKTEDGWQEIGLQQALEEIAEKMKKIIDEYGARSMSVWKGEAIGFSQEEELYRRFVHAFGSPNYFSNDSACFNGRWIGYSLVAGSWIAQPDYIHSRCIVIWGSNPPHSHPNMTQDIMEAKENGAKIIVIDPRLSPIARQADIFVQVKPGTDGALAHGIIRELINNGYYDKDFVKDYTKGFDELREYSQKFTPEWVEEETGVPAELLQEVAKTMAQRAPNVAIYVGNGPEHHENGINNIRAMASIDGILGSFDAYGGNYMPEGFGARKLTLYDELPLRELGPIGSDKFPVLYDFRQECHTMTAMDTILTEKPYPIKGMILTAANPVNTNPNIEKVKKAFSNLELLVVRELFMTETAELADYILPAASFFERAEIHCHGGRQIANLTKRIVSLPEVQDEYQFLHDLAHLIGAGEYFPWENEEELNRWLVEPTGTTIEELEKHPDGYNYKPMRYQKYKERREKGEKPFNTPSGKIEFTSQYLKDLGFDELPVYKSPAYIAKGSDEYPYVLVTGARKLLFYHSRNHNFKRCNTAFPRPEVEVHPEDAKALGVKDGDMVRVTSKKGSLDIPVTVVAKNEILPGVFQITHGWKEANVNLITHDDVFDPLSGFPLMKSVEIKVEKI